MDLFVEKEWLLNNLENHEVRIADCRFTLGQPDAGRNAYSLGHIPGAVYFDLEKDLSGKVNKHGGRHPLPDMGSFKAVLENAGISDSTTVVVYDKGEGAFASRLIWMLEYIGHQKVHFLQGGYWEWRESGYPAEITAPVYKKGEISMNLQHGMVSDIEEIQRYIQNNEEIILIDSREEKRYKGIEEKIDKKAGHIPGAINKVWTECLLNGRFKKADEQKERFKELDANKKIVVYCGSGVTAAPNYLALKQSGYSIVSIYAGSFSDYISYDENPVAIEK